MLIFLASASYLPERVSNFCCNSCNWARLDSFFPAHSLREGQHESETSMKLFLLGFGRNVRIIQKRVSHLLALAPPPSLATHLTSRAVFTQISKPLKLSLVAGNFACFRHFYNFLQYTPLLVLLYCFFSHLVFQKDNNRSSFP